jgi:hypothetical protein
VVDYVEWNFTIFRHFRTSSPSTIVLHKSYTTLSPLSHLIAATRRTEWSSWRTAVD